MMGGGVVRGGMGVGGGVGVACGVGVVGGVGVVLGGAGRVPGMGSSDFGIVLNAFTTHFLSYVRTPTRRVACHSS